ncbi:MAG TPA: hypothetical protein VF527_20780 [Pyrinomonadaceae bacterium]|jgi:hypothetical protein
MKELDHDDMRYEGLAGEVVTVTVKPEGTTQLVTYTLSGVSSHLTPSSFIRFTLAKQPNDQAIVLQMNFDFNGEGNYTVGVTSVTNEPNNECVHVVDGPPLAIKIFRFFVN